MKTREQEEKRFNISRSNLLAVIILTSVNIFLTISNTDLHFLFSASIPMMLLYFISGITSAAGNFTYSAAGIIAAFVAMSFYGICWYLSKKHRGWIVAALVFFAIDTLALIILWAIFSPSRGIDISLAIEFAFIAWVMYYLIIGTNAWYKLKNMLAYEESEFDQTPTAIGMELGNKPSAPARTIPVAQMPLSIAIRESSKKGKVLISQSYNNMEIVVKRAFGVTELIVDGVVYAEKTGVYEGKSYMLEANVNNVIINATMELPSIKTAIKEDVLPTMYLYINGNLAAEKARYF